MDLIDDISSVLILRTSFEIIRVTGLAAGTTFDNALILPA